MKGCGKRMKDCGPCVCAVDSICTYVCVCVCVRVFVSKLVCGRTPLCALAYLAPWGGGVAKSNLIKFALQLNRLYSLKSQRNIVICIFLCMSEHVSPCFCLFVARYCIPHLLAFSLCSVIAGYHGVATLLLSWLLTWLTLPLLTLPKLPLHFQLKQRHAK